MPEPLLTTADIARILSRTPEAVIQARYRKMELPPAIKIGRRLYWRPEDVEAWLAANAERGEAPALEVAEAPQLISTVAAGGDHRG